MSIFSYIAKLFRALCCAIKRIVLILSRVCEIILFTIWELMVALFIVGIIICLSTTVYCVTPLIVRGADHFTYTDQHLYFQSNIAPSNIKKRYDIVLDIYPKLHYSCLYSGDEGSTIYYGHDIKNSVVAELHQEPAGFLRRMRNRAVGSLRNTIKNKLIIPLLFG